MNTTDTILAKAIAAAEDAIDLHISHYGPDLVGWEDGGALPGGYRWSAWGPSDACLEGVMVEVTQDGEFVADDWIDEPTMDETQANATYFSGGWLDEAWSDYLGRVLSDELGAPVHVVVTRIAEPDGVLTARAVAEVDDTATEMTAAWTVPFTATAAQWRAAGEHLAEMFTDDLVAWVREVRAARADS